jgi:hypothetical protein
MAQNYQTKPTSAFVLAAWQSKNAAEQADPAAPSSQIVYTSARENVTAFPPAQFAAREKSFMPFSSARSGLA